MWADALQMLARAEKMQQQLCEPKRSKARPICWEPPVDMLETEGELLILAALPGVDPEQISARITDGILLISGQRVLPAQLRTAKIHRLELPQGSFERRVALPAGRYEIGRPGMANGLLVITLHKKP